MDKVGSYNLHAGRNRHFVACKVHHHGLGVYEKNKQGIRKYSGILGYWHRHKEHIVWFLVETFRQDRNFKMIKIKLYNLAALPYELKNIWLHKNGKGIEEVLYVNKNILLRDLIRLS